jgi:hypothetical protein
VRHADEATFEQLQDLLASLRKLPGVVERRPGAFSFRSRALLHFHDDPTGPYADLKVSPEEGFRRFRVRTKADQTAFVRQVRAAISA